MKKRQSNTCIAVLQNKKTKKLIMAGDRRVSWGASQAQAMPHPKISKRAGLLMGATGDGDLCDLIVHIMEIDVQSDLDNMTFFHQYLYEKIKTLLLYKGYGDEHGILRIPTDLSSEILIGRQKELYSIIIENPENEGTNLYGNISIGQLNVPYATGCGGSLAWGSLLTTKDLKISEEDRLTIALKVAASVSPGCDANIDIFLED